MFECKYFTSERLIIHFDDINGEHIEIERKKMLLCVYFNKEKRVSQQIIMGLDASISPHINLLTVPHFPVLGSKTPCIF